MNNKKKFLSMDIVFYGRSLNYDQGAGNLQELKKVTIYDGSVHTLVSRYALRYSILETGKNSEFWQLAGKNELSDESSTESETGDKQKDISQNESETEADKSEESDSTSDSNSASDTKQNTIQPKESISTLTTFPEFDLFGYMITKDENITRTSPVKISHAISLSPYNFDSHFCGNHRLAKEVGKGPNLFNPEEHYSFYVYNVTIDINRVGVFDPHELPITELVQKIIDSNKIEDLKKRFDIRTRKPPNEKANDPKEKNKLKKAIIKKLRNDPNFSELKKELTENHSLKDDEKQKRLKSLLKAILYLKRNIKGRREDISPWLIIGDVYEGSCYDTFIDKISLLKEHKTQIERKEKPLASDPDTIEISYLEQKFDEPVFKIRETSGNIISKCLYVAPGVNLQDCDGIDVTQKVTQGIKKKDLEVYQNSGTPPKLDFDASGFLQRICNKLWPEEVKK